MHSLVSTKFLFPSVDQILFLCNDRSILANLFSARRQPSSPNLMLNAVNCTYPPLKNTAEPYKPNILNKPSRPPPKNSKPAPHIEISQNPEKIVHLASNQASARPQLPQAPILLKGASSKILNAIHTVSPVISSQIYASNSTPVQFPFCTIRRSSCANQISLSHVTGT